ncbi:MAG: tRNA epoxyqueuosine(34) reductase QueG, partial [Pseudomonadota bacterium]|nr:tRNA epoxyqueuosine(34) reductase QueG [Pseudomonadota bacterium]
DYAKVADNSLAPLSKRNTAYIARYARGRDYHKVMRKRLQKLADKIQSEVGQFGYRAFVDSAPVLERALAEKSGLGWIGKNTMLINKHAGSWFFLGELFTDLPLPVDEPATDHCGSCRACLDVCPTDAFIAPNKMDAKRCISYLTIELRGSIPVEFRQAMGNRVFGCDDCQLVCPWNKFTRISKETDYSPRHALDRSELLDLFMWSKQEFMARTEGSPIRRIGYECWLRNLAVGLGNAKSSPQVLAALRTRRESVSVMVKEHIDWALAQHEGARTEF